MKVLTILSKLEMGGIEKTLLSCIPFLNDSGVKMSILCSLGGALDNDFQALGVELIDFGSHKKPFKDALYLRKLLKNNSFDIVHSRYGHTSGLFAKICNDMNIPFLVSIHNERAMFKNNWIGKPLLGSLRGLYLSYHKNLTIKYATKIIGHSKANLKYFVNDVDDLCTSSQFIVLYNGVDFAKFESYKDLDIEKREVLDHFLSESNKVLVHIGSFKEQKNHTKLIDIFQGLSPKQNNYKLLLLGDGALLPKIKEEVHQYGLDNYVLFIGVETNIAPYLKAADLFIFPSLYEGFGNVLIEAQYVNLPIAASNIAPHFEAVYNGYHNYFFNPNDTDGAVIQVNKILKQDGDSSELIKDAKLFSSNFSIKNMALRLVEIYSKRIR